MLKYPDGTYSYAFKSGSRDAWLELREDPSQSLLSPYQVMQIEDEIEFMVNNLEFILDPDLAIRQYLYHRVVLFILMMINLFFELALTIYIYRNQDILLAQLNRIYRGYSQEYLKQVLVVTTSINTTFNLAQYAFSFFAILSHRVTNYQMLNIFMIVGIFFRVIMSYVNLLNLLMLVLKCFTYVYCRYVLSLLFGILILPN